MTRVELVVVAIRLLAAWFLIQGIAILFYTSSTPLLAGDQSIAVTTLIEFVLFCAVTVLTWRFAEAFATRVLPEPDPGVTITSLGKQDLEDVLLRVLGFFLGLTALSGLLYSLVAPPYPGAAPGEKHHLTPEIVRAMFQLTAGLCLVLGRTGWKRLVETIRMAATSGMMRTMPS